MSTLSRRSAVVGTTGLSLAALMNPASASTHDPSLPGNGDERYTPTHYSVGNTIMTSSKTNARLYGSTTITARAETTLTSLYVDCALTVTGAVLNGAKVSVTRTSWRQVKISGFTSLRAGSTFTLKLTYDDYPNARCRTAFHNGVWEKGSSITFSGQPDSSIYWFPSNDRLDVKATFDFSISTQASNEIIGYRTPDSYYRWTPAGGVPMINARSVISEPSATYHPGLTVGPYSVRRGTWNIAGVTTPYLIAGMGTIPTALAQTTPKALDYFARLYGPYPYRVAGGVSVPDLPVGAQENVGCSSYGSALVADSYSGASAFVAHENAHMWFGNSVTAMRWNDVLLLQEGLAVLLENDYVQRFGGRSTYTPVLSSAKGNYGPSALAQKAPYNSVYYIQRELRRAMDGTTVQSSAPHHTAFLKDLATRYKHSSITRNEFKALAASHSPRNLNSFWSTYGF